MTQCTQLLQILYCEELRVRFQLECSREYAKSTIEISSHTSENMKTQIEDSRKTSNKPELDFIQEREDANDRKFIYIKCNNENKYMYTECCCTIGVLLTSLKQSSEHSLKETDGYIHIR